MTSKLTILLFSVFFTTTVFGQSNKLNDTIPRTVTIHTTYGDLVLTGTYGSSFQQAQLDLGGYRDNIYKEAEEKEIGKDVVYVKFIHDSNCLVVDVQVLKLGKLKSFGEYAQSWCIELKKKLEEINDSGFFGEDPSGFCNEHRFPLKLYLM